MAPLATPARGGPTTTWTREKTIAALRRYAALYGQPTSAAFNPSLAKWRDDALAAERYVLGDPETGAAWPSLNTIKGTFGGSFNDALEAAGLPRNKPGPAAGKRAAGKHRPRRDVAHVTRTVFRDRKEDTTAIERAERQRDRALARAEKAEAALATVKAKTITKTVKVRDDAALTAARREARDAKAEARKLDRELAKLRDAHEAEQRVRLARERELSLAAKRLEAAGARVPEVVEVEKVVTRTVEKVVERPHPGEAAIEAARARARAAERQAAEAGRDARAAEAAYAELVTAVKGQSRVLTRAEMDELRANGPAGPGLLAAAITEVAKARKNGGIPALKLALRKLAAAAVAYEERLR